MTDTRGSFADFIAGLEIPDGEPLELTPWQQAIADGMLGPINFDEIQLAHRAAGRRWAHAQTIAAALLIDERDVLIATPDELAGRRARDDVRQALEELGRLLEVPIPVEQLLSRVRVNAAKLAH